MHDKGDSIQEQIRAKECKLKLVQFRLNILGVKQLLNERGLIFGAIENFCSEFAIYQVI